MKLTYALALGAALLLLSACAPTIQVQHNVLPTLVSVSVPQDGSRAVVLQGRYFGDGQGGQAEDSYVLVGADIAGQGGLRVRATEWSASRIVFTAPSGAGRGYVFVVSRGVRSNGLPANLP